jgi:hypothetical protein
VALSRCRTLEGIVLLSPIPSHALTNAREVLSFTQQQASLEMVQQQLTMAQSEYLGILLCSLYDFRELIEYCYALNRMIKKMTSVQNVDDDYLLSIITCLEDLQQVGERFQQQLYQLVYQSNLNRLLERLLAAKGYFAPILQDLILQMRECSLRSNDKADATVIKHGLTDIFAMLSRMEYMQSSLVSTQDEQCLTPVHFFHLRSQFRFKDPNFAIYTTVRKLRHADTASRSLSLLLKGHRISEIAQLRGLTQKTVIKHLRTFVDNGVIKLSDFHPSDRFWIRL